MQIPWLFPDFSQYSFFSLTFNKIPWLFPSLEFPWLFPDRWTPCNQLIYRSGPTIVLKMKEIQKVVQKLSRGQESAAAAAGSGSGSGGGGGGVRTGTKT